MTKREPNADETENIEYGLHIASALGALDLGQTVVIRAKACVALNDTCGSAGIQSCVNNLSIAANSHIWVFSGRYGSYQTTPAEHELRVDTL